MPSGRTASLCGEKFSCYQICSELPVRCPVHYLHLPTFPFRVTWLETVHFPIIPCTQFAGSRSTVSQNDFFQPSNTFRFSLALIYPPILPVIFDIQPLNRYKRGNKGQSKCTYVQRPRKLHILCFRLKPKAHSFRCSSFPQRNRFTGFRWGPQY